MPVNGHTSSSHTLFAPRQDGQPVLSRAPVTADATPSAVRPSGLPAARAPFHTAPSVADESSVDGERPALRGWQDKGARGLAPSASPQPAPVTESARSSPANTSGVRWENPPATRERKERASIWRRPGVKSALQRLAQQDGLSFSAACADALEVFARAKIHEQEEALFEPRFRTIAREENRSLGNRLIFFEMRNAIAAEQTRILTADLYKRQLQKEGVSQEKIQEKLDKAYRLARSNVLKKTLQLKTLLDAWWGETEEGSTEDRAAGRGKGED
jgi:hypothetical protein